MVRPGDRALALRIEEGLTTFDQTRRNLPGIQPLAQRETLLAQIIESVRRVRYVSVIKERGVSERRADPNDDLFDPLKASVLFHEQGELDEAFWMVFFFVHFGKHSRAGWRYAREVYGSLGKPNHRWDWATTSGNPGRFPRMAKCPPRANQNPWRTAGLWKPSKVPESRRLLKYRHRSSI